MRSRLARACALLLCVLACGSIAAAPEDAGSEAFARGNLAFASGDWADALAWFKAARDSGMDTPAVLYNIGVCQYRLGAYADAEQSFAELAAHYPAMAALADYNLGLSLYRQRQAAPATSAFERAAAGEDPKVARMAAAMLARIAPERDGAAPGVWTAFVDFALGFDDNVALIDDASLPAGQSTDSAFAAFFGQLGGRATDSGFGGSAGGYFVRYPDATQFDQNIVYLAGTWRGPWRDWSFEAGPHASFSTLAGDSFERRLGVSLTLAHALDATTLITAKSVLESVEELDERYAFVDGSRASLELGLERRTGSGTAAVEYELSVDDRAAGSVSPTRHRITLRYRRVLDDRWSFAAAAAFRSSRYDDLSEPRDEDRGELAMAVLRDLSRGWQLTLDFRHSRNASNVDDFDYERNRLQLGLNRVFQ